MRSQSVLSLLAGATAAVAQTQSAPAVVNNPVGAQYVVELAPKGKWTVAGAVKIASGADGKGVSVEVAIAGLPSEDLGPFMYHIHEKAVPADGNCTGAGAHLDPYKRGETPPCDASNPSSCQTGDLSGKHGNMTSASFSATYNDEFLATLASDPSFFGDKSLVVHTSNKTRIACANFKMLSAGGESSSYAATPATSMTSAAPVVGTSYGTSLPTMSAPGGHNNTVTSSSPSGATGATMQPTASPTSSSTGSPSPVNSNGAGKLATGGAALFAFAALMML